MKLTTEEKAKLKSNIEKNQGIHRSRNQPEALW